MMYILLTLGELVEAIDGSDASIRSILNDVSIPIQHVRLQGNSRA